MNVDSERLDRLLVGEDRRRTRRAVILAGVLVVVAMVADYLALSYHVGTVETTFFMKFRWAFTLAPIWEHGLVSPTQVYGYVLVVGLAAVHAYLNSGYLTSVLLASAPPIGTAFWYIGGMDEYLLFAPELVFGSVFPEAPIMATLGFVLGLGIRTVKRKDMNLRHGIAARAALLTTIAGGASVFPTVINRIFVADAGGWLPSFGSVGRTVMTYTYTTRLVAFLAVPVGALALGYWTTDRLELVAAYRTFVVSLLVGGTAGFLLGTVTIGLLVSQINLTVLLVLATVGNVGSLVEFVLAAFAGAAFAEIRLVERASDGQSGAERDD